jgi:replicative DNA helicase
MRHDEQAEMSVLGAIILKPSALNDAMKHIHGQNYFWIAKNQFVWIALMDMILSGKPIDYTTLCAKMACEIVQEKIEPNYFMQLTDCVPSPELCEHYAKIVAEEYRARELSRNAQLFFNGVEAKEIETVKDGWEALYSKAQEILSGNQSEEEPSIHTLANELADIKPETGWGTPWGIQEMDSIFHEISPGAIVVIGGRPGHNKTALALQLVDGWLARGKKVLYHSLEMI